MAKNSVELLLVIQVSKKTFLEVFAVIIISASQVKDFMLTQADKNKSQQLCAVQITHKLD